MVRVEGTGVAVGPVGETGVAMLTVPAKPLMLVTFSARDVVSVAPRETVSDGLAPKAACTSKYGWFENFALCAVSGLLPVAPLLMVIHNPLLMLVFEQPF